MTVTGKPELAETVSRLSVLRSRFGGVAKLTDWLNFTKEIVLVTLAADANSSFPIWLAVTEQEPLATAGIGVVATSTGPEVPATI